MTTHEISNSDDVIDSRDIIARIEELGELMADALGDDGNGCWSVGDEAELAALLALAKEAESAPDWTHGETLIRDDYFVAYTEELISDCYEMPKQINSGEWPYRHMKVDFDAAAQELKQDYFDVDYDGVTYWVRA